MFMVRRLVRENARWQNEEEQEMVGMSAEEKNKAVVRHFNEQDLALQMKMRERGLFRWGSTWVSAR